MRKGYTLEWVASEIGVPKRRIEYWISRGVLRGSGRGGNPHDPRYSPEFVTAARRVHEWLQLYPRGPLENLREQMYPEPDEDEDAA